MDLPSTKDTVAIPVTYSPRVQDEISLEDCDEAVIQHLHGDAGEVSPGQLLQNARHMLKRAGRVFSAYRTRGGEIFWVLTEADWTGVVVLFPEEYEEYRRLASGGKTAREAVQ